jgi:hypothetical protein
VKIRFLTIGMGKAWRFGYGAYELWVTVRQEAVRRTRRLIILLLAL